MTKQTFKIACMWKMYGVMEIEAETLEEAERIAIEEAPLPTDGDYIECSFELDEESYIHGEIKKY